MGPRFRGSAHFGTTRDRHVVRDASAHLEALRRAGVTAQESLAWAPSRAWVERLVAEGARLRSAEGRTALAHAAAEHRSELVGWLLEQGLRTDRRTHDGWPVLARAVDRLRRPRNRGVDRLLTLRQLLEAGADPHAPAPDGRVPHQLALDRRDPDLAAFIAGVPRRSARGCQPRR